MSKSDSYEQGHLALYTLTLNHMQNRDLFFFIIQSAILSVSYNGAQNTGHFFLRTDMNQILSFRREQCSEFCFEIEPVNIFAALKYISIKQSIYPTSYYVTIVNNI